VKRWAGDDARVWRRARHWTVHEIDYLLRAVPDGHTAAAIGGVIGRSEKSVIRKIAQMRMRLKFSRGYSVKFYLTPDLHARLQELAGEVGMNPTRTARMILVATLRDPQLADMVVRP
jgi:hypothetical protein